MFRRLYRGCGFKSLWWKINKDQIYEDIKYIIDRFDIVLFYIFRFWKRLAYFIPDTVLHTSVDVKSLWTGWRILSFLSLYIIELGLVPNILKYCSLGIKAILNQSMFYFWMTAADVVNCQWWLYYTLMSYIIDIFMA